MKTVRIAGERQVELVDRPDPLAALDIALVRVHVAPMCTEYKAYRAGYLTDILGHEAAGEVVEIRASSRLKAGDRVVVMPLYPCGRCSLCVRGDYIYCPHGRGVHAETGSQTGTATYADLLLKPDWVLLPIPDDLSTEHAAMACCGLGPTFGAMERMQVSAPDTILITGMGPVGLGGVINATYRGAKVIAVESHPYRAALAKTLGAGTVIDPESPTARDEIRELTGGIGPDKGLDCSGAAAAHRLLIDTVRRRGHVAFVGEGGEFSLHVSNDMLRKGLTLHGCWHYNRGDAPRLLQMIRDSSDAINMFITHRFPLDRVQEAFELQLTGNCGKVILTP